MTFSTHHLTVGSPQHAIRAAFRAWARDRGLWIGHTNDLRILGNLGGREVVVDPGVDGLLPRWVEITVRVSLPDVKPVLVTRATRPMDLATACIRALFDDRDLGPELRAVSISAHRLLLRLAPGAAPPVVEHAVRAVADTLRV
jgi:hypothetical protein